MSEPIIRIDWYYFQPGPDSCPKCQDMGGWHLHFPPKPHDHCNCEVKIIELTNVYERRCVIRSVEPGPTIEKYLDLKRDGGLPVVANNPHYSEMKEVDLEGSVLIPAEPGRDVSECENPNNLTIPDAEDKWVRIPGSWSLAPCCKVVMSAKVRLDTYVVTCDEILIVQGPPPERDKYELPQRTCSFQIEVPSDSGHVADFVETPLPLYRCDDREECESRGLGQG